MKRILLLFLIFCLFTNCSNRYKEYIEEINNNIKNIQFAINTADKDLFEKYSKTNSFFNFYSLISMAGRYLSNKDVIILTPIKYSGNENKIITEISLGYIIPNIRDLNRAIPEDIFKNVIKFGLPTRVKVLFKREDNRFIAVSYRFPLQYFYMNLLITSDSD